MFLMCMSFTVLLAVLTMTFWQGICLCQYEYQWNQINYFYTKKAVLLSSIFWIISLFKEHSEKEEKEKDRWTSDL